MQKWGKWLLNMFVNVFVTMIFIYIIKKASNRYNIPLVKQIADEV